MTLVRANMSDTAGSKRLRLRGKHGARFPPVLTRSRAI